MAKDSNLDVLALAKFLQAFDSVGRYRHHHSFLGFADPYFGVAEPFVLERSLVEPNFGANRFPHFADGAAKATSTAVGYRCVETLIASLEQHVHHHLFSDCVADLNRSARNVFAFLSQLDATKRCPMDAISARSATDGHNQVAWHRLLFDLVDRDDADVPAVHKWIPQVAIVEVYGTIDRRDAHAIAIVSDARHDPFHDATRVQYCGRQIVGIKVGGSKAEDICVAYWFCTEACPEWISDHTTKPRVCTSIRLDSRWMVVCFYLEYNVILVIEFYDTCIIFEDAHAPIVFA